MKRCWIGLAAYWLVLAAVFALQSCSRGPSRKSFALNIAFLAETNGRLEPCGCFSGQYGGLTRVKTFLGNNDPAGSLFVDVGNAIAGPEDYHAIQYKYLRRAYDSIGFDVMNLGQRECQLALPDLRKLSEGGDLPLISVNVLEAKTRERLFPPYVIVERGGYRIGCVGVVDAEGLGDTLGEGVAVEPMETALGNLLPEVAEKTDVIVLLAFASEERMKELARTFYELDLILGGDVRQPSQELVRENRSVILYTTNESRALGLLSARLEPGGKFVAEAFDVQLMHDQIPQAESIHALSAAYHSEIRRTSLDVDDPHHRDENRIPGVAPAAQYMGSQACAECHREATAVWEKTGHAHAFESLEARDSDADPNCIGCHTVGFGEPSGYRREFRDTRLTDVGCETCHGPGSEHVTQHRAGGVVSFEFRPLAAPDCQRCHFGEFSRPFNWEVFWPQIAHGLDGKEPKS